MSLTNLYEAIGKSIFHSQSSFRIPEPQTVKRDEHGIEIDPFYQPHIVEYHCVDTTRLIRKGRSPGSAKSPTPSGGKDWNADE